MICEYSLFEIKNFHKSYLNYVAGFSNSVERLLRRTLVRSVILLNKQQNVQECDRACQSLGGGHGATKAE